MSLTGKLVSQVPIKTDADHAFLFSYAPPHVSTVSPTNIKGVNLHNGDWGTVGSIISWNYAHEGKEKVSKERIEAIDQAKKLVKFKVIEGDLLDLYKTFVVTVHVDAVNGDSSLVTWTIEYEKKNANVTDPNTYLDFCKSVTKDIETRHLK